MACRQRYELLAPAGQERIGANDERAGMQFDEGCECGIYLGFGTSLPDIEVHLLRARRLLQVSDHGLCSRVGRVHKQGD
jgi:hypothetical protein